MTSVYVVTDTETMKKDGAVFDIAYKSIDAKGKVYGKGSFLITDVFKGDNFPFYWDKIGTYFNHVHNGLIKPMNMEGVRNAYNDHLIELLRAGHTPIIAAYNAAFDTRALGLTSKLILGKPFLKINGLQMICIWHYWAMSAPATYFSRYSEAGNLATSAEDVYRYEFSKPDFVEDHIAHSDVNIECDILLKTLSRRKKKPLVSNPNDFKADPWRLVQERANLNPKDMFMPKQGKGIKWQKENWEEMRDK